MKNSLTVLALIFCCSGCTTQLGIGLGSPSTQDCVPGSVSRPCNQLK